MAAQVLSVSIFFIAFLSLTAKCPGQIKNLPVGKPFRLKNISALSNGEMWSVGGAGSLVVYSRGQPKTFTISSEDLNALFFVDEETAIVVGDHGEIIVTTDRGATWNKQSSGTTTDLQSIYCVDIDNCWIVGKDKGIVLFGGPHKTWTDRVSTSVDTNLLYDASDQKWRGKRVVGNGSFQDVYFVNKAIGYAVGRNGLVLKTKDGGKVWVKINVPVKLRVNEFIDGIPDFESVVFKNTQTGCIAGWDVGTGIVACTKDGGDSWTVSLKDELLPYGIIWSKNDEILIIDSNGANIRSSDLGKTWIPQSSKITKGYMIRGDR